MSTTLLLQTPVLIFFGKIFACGLLGFFILGLLQALVEIKINPKGWKFGKEFFNPEDPENVISDEKRMRYNYNPIKNNSWINKRRNSKDNL